MDPKMQPGALLSYMRRLYEVVGESEATYRDEAEGVQRPYIELRDCGSGSTFRFQRRALSQFHLQKPAPRDCVLCGKPDPTRCGCWAGDGIEGMTGKRFYQVIDLVRAA